LNKVLKEDKTNKEIAEQYLDMISLDSGDRQASEHDDAAQLMTLHSAKGLEFKLVLMTGLEESLISSWEVYGKSRPTARGEKAMLRRHNKSYGKVIYNSCRIKKTAWFRYF
jgi:superfamily I DNA/RNA helicase